MQQIKWVKLNKAPNPACNLYIFHHSGNTYIFINFINFILNQFLEKVEVQITLDH